jgi:preprotein translocase subunit YajC
MFGLTLLAQAAGGPSGLGSMLFFGVIIAIMYFMMLRPQAKQLKEHRALLAGLKKGDDVVTQGGILGRIYAITDRIVTLEIASGVRVRVLKTSIQGRAAVAEEAAPAKAEEKKEEK